jgi:asparagine synthase (glutamine-hydrolysing)
MRTALLPETATIRNDPVLNAAAASPGADAMSSSFATDLSTWVPDDLLVKVDRTTMAFGLEARPPFLDHELVEAVIGLPLDQRWRPGRDKPLLRDLAATLLPSATAERPKQTFTTPAAAWLRGPLAASLAEATTALLDAGVQRQVLTSLMTRSVGGGRDGGQWAWTMYVLGRWIVDHPRAGSFAHLR